jgi:predicted HD superfamily hydrolase involved in NAD metabolism
MSQLSCIVFVADAIEPNRGNSPELEIIRSLSPKNLHAAVWRTCDYGFKHLLETRCLIHPRTILTRNWALKVSS